MYRHKIGENLEIKYFIGNICKCKGDVILNWTNSKFNYGNFAFFDIYKAGECYDFTIVYDDKMLPGDCLSTPVSRLNYKLILHTIITKDYNASVRNIIYTLKRYIDNDNVCNNLYLTLPDENFDNFIDNIKLYESLLPKDFIFYIVCRNEEQLKALHYKFEKEITTKERIYYKLDSFFYKTLSIYENYRKKLSKNFKRIRSKKISIITR